MRTATCRGCGREIVWIQTAGGKSMPCDASPVYYKERAGGPDRIVTQNGMTLSCEIVTDPNIATGIGYVPHWATCPQAGKFKKERTTR